MIAVIRGIDNNCIIQHAFFLQAIHNPPNIMVNQRNHAVIIGGHFAQLFLRLIGHPRPLLAKFFQDGVLDFRLRLQGLPVPPGPPVQILFQKFWQFYIRWVMQHAPGFRAIKGVMRVWKGSPDTKRRFFFLFGNPVDSPVPYPARAMPGNRQPRCPGLRRPAIGPGFRLP